MMPINEELEERRHRVKLSSVYGKRLKKFRKLGPDAKHLNFLLNGEAHNKLVRMVGETNKSYFIEQLILREYARREKREAQRVEDVCTNSCADSEAVS